MQEERSILQNLQLATHGCFVVGWIKGSAACMSLGKLNCCIPSEEKGKEIEWIQCDQCGEVGSETKGWFHTFCVGISNEEVENTEFDQFRCPLCKQDISSPEDIINLQQDKVKMHMYRKQSMTERRQRLKRYIQSGS